MTGAARPPRHRAGRQVRRRLARLERRLCAEVCAELAAERVGGPADPPRRSRTPPARRRSPQPAARCCALPARTRTSPPAPRGQQQPLSRDPGESTRTTERTSPPPVPWQLSLIELDPPEYDPEQPAVRSNVDDPRGRPAPLAVPWYCDESGACSYHRRPLTPRPPEPRVIPTAPCMPEL